MNTQGQDNLGQDHAGQNHLAQNHSGQNHSGTDRQDQAPSLDQPDPQPSAQPTADEALPAAPLRRSGLRLGPFVWVSELTTTGEGDPWKHRKGEPRVFTLLWTAYLMLAAFGTLLSAQALGVPRAGQFTWGARSLLVLIAIGVSVLWPVTRLSQVAAQRPIRALLADLIVIMLPIVAVLIPLPLMTSWSLPVAGGLGLMLLSWACVAATVIWLGWRQRSHWARGIATLGVIAIAALGPALELFLIWLGYASRPWWIAMASPTTAVFALTHAASGLAVRMTAGEWLACLLPLSLVPLLIALGLADPGDTDEGLSPGSVGGQ